MIILTSGSLLSCSDYPSFYTRLYAFLDRDVLHSKHRARFFRLTELFLSSRYAIHLQRFPNQLKADNPQPSPRNPPCLIRQAPRPTFLKRTASSHRDGHTLHLQYPQAPSSAHGHDPSYRCRRSLRWYVLNLHFLFSANSPNDLDLTDPFLASEPNPISTQALSSSLWELISHKSHYHAGVSTLVKIFSEAFTKPGYSMEDFLDHTYGTVRPALFTRVSGEMLI